MTETQNKCAVKEPELKLRINQLNHELRTLGNLKSSIYTKIGAIDNLSHPSVEDVKKDFPLNCLNDELDKIIRDLIQLNTEFEQINSRLQNQLG